MRTDKKPKQEKFNFEKMRAAATSDDRNVRKTTFVEYFERFQEFPSYLFDNETVVDARLAQTIQDLMKDPETTASMHKGIELLRRRLPS